MTQPEFNVLRQALKEIDVVVGNESHLDEVDCAHLRGILTAALNDGFSEHGIRARAHPEPAMRWIERRSADRGDQR